MRDIEDTNSVTKRIFNMWMCPIGSISVSDRRLSMIDFIALCRTREEESSRSGSTVVNSPVTRGDFAERKVPWYVRAKCPRIYRSEAKEK